jgi:hypothetical protein
MNMSLESLIILLIVAAVVGTLAQLLSGYSRGGLLGSICSASSVSLSETGAPERSDYLVS